MCTNSAVSGKLAGRAALHWIAGVAVFIAGQTAQAATPLISYALTQDTTIEADVLVVPDESALVSDSSSSVSLLPLGSLPQEAAVDAISVEPDGLVLFSLDAAANLGGTAVLPADVIGWDGANYFHVLSSSAHLMEAGSNIDAISKAPDGSLVLSFSVGRILDGAAYADEDLVQWRPGPGFLPFFDASAAGVPADLDLDAVHVLANGNLLVSFDTHGMIDGVAFQDADILEYGPGGWELALAASALPTLPDADVDGFYAVTDIDSDGIADSSDNCLLVVNQPQRDTDGDGIGNFCDADLDNNCVINFNDLGILRDVFFTTDPDADFNGDGVVNAGDLAIMRNLFFLPPGPSGVPDACD